MTRLDTLIVKFSSRCNLACTYCYEYFSGDQTWMAASKTTSTPVLTRIGQRIREYCEGTGQSQINVVLHGGEPLLVGPSRLEKFLPAFRAAAAPVSVRYSVQTNGTLITPRICDILNRHNVLVGISLDGSFEANFRRVTLKGQPTSVAIAESIDLIKTRAPHLFAGVLCVINLDADPIETIATLCAHGPPEIDLLYPFVTHDQAGPDREAVALKFGGWMVTAMNYWMNHPQFCKIKVRIFEDALQATISRRPKTDWFGPRNISYLVIDTDGNYDLLDQLKVIGTDSPHYRSLARNVENCSIREAVALAAELLKRSAGDVLPTDCAGCNWADICAASHLPARHSLQRGFNNRSVYCEGIKHLLETADNAMARYKEARVCSDFSQVSGHLSFPANVNPQ